MTVASTNVRNSYNGDGSTTTFAFNFEILSKNELGVYIRSSTGAETKRVVDTHYTIDPSYIMNPAGGNVVFATLYIPTATEKVILIRESAQTQGYDITTGGSIVSESLEDSLDKLTLLVQELKEKTDRATLLKVTSALAALTFPEPGADCYIKWNAAGTALVAVSVLTPGALTVSAFIQTLLDDIDAATARATLGVNQTNIGISAYSQTLTPLTTQLAWKTALGISGIPGINYIVNGGCMVAQRPTQAMAAAVRYGKVDRFQVELSNGSVSAGNITQALAAPIGRTGAALHVSGITTTGASSKIVVYHRIESTDAKKLKNQNASFQVKVQHDKGSSVDYTITIKKANVADNFGAVTTIATGTVTAVPTATPTALLFENVAMGDCSNGIQIEVSAAVGAQTTKNYYYTEFQLEVSPTATQFEQLPFHDAIEKCFRFYWKTFAYITEPAQAIGATAGSVTATAYSVTARDLVFNVRLPTAMRYYPAITMYNPVNANDDWYGSAGDKDAIIQNIGDIGFSVASNAATVIGVRYYIHLTADADFY